MVDEPPDGTDDLLRPADLVDRDLRPDFGMQQIGEAGEAVIEDDVTDFRQRLLLQIGHVADGRAVRQQPADQFQAAALGEDQHRLTIERPGEGLPDRADALADRAPKLLRRMGAADDVEAWVPTATPRHRPSDPGRWRLCPSQVEQFDDRVAFRFGELHGRRHAISASRSRILSGVIGFSTKRKPLSVTLRRMLS